MRPLLLARTAADSPSRDTLAPHARQEPKRAWNSIANDFPVTWKSRSTHLKAVAVAGRGVTKCIIMDRLRRRSRAELSELQIVIEDDYFVILGESGRLPWGSGGLYFGVDPKAPGLLLPTTLEPTLPAHLFEEVLHTRCSSLPEQTAVFPRPMHIVPIVGAKAFNDESVDSWLWNGRRRPSMTGSHICLTR